MIRKAKNELMTNIMTLNKTWITIKCIFIYHSDVTADKPCLLPSPRIGCHQRQTKAMPCAETPPVLD